MNFSAKDILTFLGRWFHPRFDGEVLTHYQKGRWPGARIKHRIKNNWLKMYDKFALVLRIETVINNPRKFRVRRLRTRDGHRQMVAFSRADPEQSGSHRIVHPLTVRDAADPETNSLLSIDNTGETGTTAARPAPLHVQCTCTAWVNRHGACGHLLDVAVKGGRAVSVSLRVRRGRIFRFFLSIDRRVYCGSPSP